MPAQPKAADELVRRNRPASLGEFTSDLAIPLPPHGLSQDLRVKWGLLWTSPVAQLFDPVSDVAGLSRLFELYALGARLDELIAQADPHVEVEGMTPLELAEAMTEAAAARQALNSTVGARMRVATEARALEAQFGLSPRSRLALGLTVLAGKAAAKAGGLDSFLEE